MDCYMADNENTFVMDGVVYRSSREGVGAGTCEGCDIKEKGHTSCSVSFEVIKCMNSNRIDGKAVIFKKTDLRAWVKPGKKPLPQMSEEDTDIINQIL